MTECELVVQQRGAASRLASPPPLVDAPVVVEHAATAATWYVRNGKRAMDCALAVLLLVIAAPVMAVVALAVRASVGRPLIFRQTRIGHGGRPFEVLKFRTMRADRRTTGKDRRTAARQEDEDRRRTHKSAHDPRLTPTGRVLRTLSLDELPQLINVLKGEMSLVGPRPELSAVVERYHQPWHHRRHDVRPGITGLWQVTERGNGLMHEHVDVDLDYVDRVGPLLDLKILLLTVPAALGSRRGY